MQFIAFFLTTSHRLPRSFFAFLSLHRSCFREKLQLRFRRKCDLQGREELHVASSVLRKICTPLWLVITGCIWAWSPPACLQNTHIINTMHAMYTLRGCIKVRYWNIDLAESFVCAHAHTLVYHPQQSPNHFSSRLPASHLATPYVTATVKQTPIIPKRCDSNPPVSPLKALETQVLQWHVSACQTQSRQHQ